MCDIYHITSPSKCTIIPLGFDLTRFQTNNEVKRLQFRQKYSISDDEIAIVIVGRVVSIKNHSLFIESLKHVIDSSKQKVRAFIVGDGDNRKVIEEQAKTLGIEYTTQNESIHNKPLCFTSWIKDVDVVYSGADIVALTSLNEGTPVSLIEAEAACKPIITTNIGGIEDIVENGVTGILVENNNSEAFGINLLKVVDDANLRENLSTKGRAFVNENYHYTRLVADVKKLYDQLLIING